MDSAKAEEKKKTKQNKDKTIETPSNHSSHTPSHTLSHHSPGTPSIHPIFHLQEIAELEHSRLQTLMSGWTEPFDAPPLSQAPDAASDVPPPSVTLTREHKEARSKLEEMHAAAAVLEGEGFMAPFGQYEAAGARIDLLWKDVEDLVQGSGAASA